MDVLDKLKEKNDKHRECIEAENKEIWNAGIHVCFFLFLIYYEYFSKSGEALVPDIITLIPIYIIYNISLLIFCKVVFTHFFFEKLIVTTFHLIFIYCWIWHQEKHGVMFILSLMLFISSMISWFKTSKNKNVWSFGIHLLFTLCLASYEVYNQIGSTFNSENIYTLIFVFIFYNLIVMWSCRVIFINSILTCLALITLHSTFIYYWIWHQEKHGVMFILSLILFISSMIYWFKTSKNKNIWSFGIHLFFTVCLASYEIYNQIGSTFNSENRYTLIFVFIFYNRIVMWSCRVISINSIFTCLALITLHSTFIYYWIWYQEKHGVAFVLGLIFILTFMISWFKNQPYEE